MEQFSLDTIKEFFLQPTVITQLGLVAALTVASFLLAHYIGKRHPAKRPHFQQYISLKAAAKDSLMYLRLPLIATILLAIGNIIFSSAFYGTQIVSIALTLTFAWLLIRLCSFFLRQRFIAKWLALFVWIVAALHITSTLDSTITLLDSVGFTVGGTSFTLYKMIKGALVLAVIIWLFTGVSNVSERYLRTYIDISPSAQVLLSKIIKIFLLIFAGMIGLNSVGIDLTALAVFSGAVGIGVGFGLQKVISNFISGIILLVDRSIKPGDIIAVNDSFGWVNTLGARYVSIITRDGKEHLVPNEQLITEKVENWSFSSKKVRLRLPIGVAYGSDVRKAISIACDIAGRFDRVVKDPAPVCRVVELGESSINLELRIWIEDPNNGTANIQSDILLLILDEFKIHNIDIPFPQREVRIKEG